MTSITIHTDTTEFETVKIDKLNVEEIGRQFLVIGIGEVSLFISYKTAKILYDKLTQSLTNLNKSN